MDAIYVSLIKGVLLAIGVALGVAALSGCAKDIAPSLAAAGYCDVARPIFWSKNDTRQTKEQADRENVKWKTLCGPAKQPATQ